MRLVQLIYCSRVASGVHGTAITSIVDVSRINNARDGVTGALCFNANFFLQCLEGERSVVNATYARILGDPRHDQAVILRYAEISARDFPDWIMGYVPSSILRGETVMRYGATDRFLPADLGPDSSIALLRDLRDLAMRLPG